MRAAEFAGEKQSCAEEQCHVRHIEDARAERPDAHAHEVDDRAAGDAVEPVGGAASEEQGGADERPRRASHPKDRDGQRDEHQARAPGEEQRAPGVGPVRAETQEGAGILDITQPQRVAEVGARGQAGQADGRQVLGRTVAADRAQHDREKQPGAVSSRSACRCVLSRDGRPLAHALSEEREEGIGRQAHQDVRAHAEYAAFAARAQASKGEQAAVIPRSVEAIERIIGRKGDGDVREREDVDWPRQPKRPTRHLDAAGLRRPKDDIARLRHRHW